MEAACMAIMDNDAHQKNPYSNERKGDGGGCFADEGEVEGRGGK